MRLKKLFLICLAGVIGILISLSLIMGAITIGNLSHSIETTYGPSQQIKGWINISIEDESSNSLLKGFNDSITLLDFLEANSDLAIFDCSPVTCESDYSVIGDGQELKTFDLNSGEREIIGFKINGELNNANKIDGVNFKVESNMEKGCTQPLKINILDDDEIDWLSFFPYEEFTCYTSKGCFSETEPNELVTIAPDKPYCEQIEIPSPFPIFNVGADVIVETVIEDENDWPQLKMEIYDESAVKKAGCITDKIQDSGEYSCIVSLNLTESKTFFVCVLGIYPSIEVKEYYKIKKESSDPVCGFKGIESYTDFRSDYSIFMESGKYDSLYGKEIIFNEEEFNKYGGMGIHSKSSLIDYLNEYIYGKYNYDCTNDCVIPISFNGLDQEIILSNLKIEYDTADANDLETTEFYEITESPAIINSLFQILKLERANILTPNEIGTKELILELGDREIFKQNILIQSVPIIKDISPKTAYALVPVTFNLITEGSQENMSYVWNFGDDNPEQTTNENTIKHTYPDVETYSLNVTVSNLFGQDAKTFQIQVLSPEEAIQQILDYYDEDLDNIEREINNFITFIKQEFETLIDIDSLKEEIGKQRAKYEVAVSSEEHVNIMEVLLELDIPQRIGIGDSFENPLFFLNEEQINLEALRNLEAGNPNKEKKEYVKAINGWLDKNLDVSIDAETYMFYYRDKENKPIFSHYKITLTPKENIDDLYLVINGLGEKIKFKGDLEPIPLTNGVGIIIHGVDDKKTIEFIHPGEIDPLNLPIYISPKLEKLGGAIDVGICNYNKICEKELGEDYKNCREDCKPLGRTILLLFILFFIGFVIYIALQEWYKKHYEKKLFSDKNQLFNLINFMNNCISQGFDKSKTFDQLSTAGWNKEQLTYAWRKLHGKRTGMWEIPLFKGSENKEVKQELAKRPKGKPGAPPRPMLRRPSKFPPRRPPKTSSRV